MQPQSKSHLGSCRKNEVATPARLYPEKVHFGVFDDAASDTTSASMSVPCGAIRLFRLGIGMRMEAISDSTTVDGHMRAPSIAICSHNSEIRDSNSCGIDHVLPNDKKIGPLAAVILSSSGDVCAQDSHRADPQKVPWRTHLRRRTGPFLATSRCGRRNGERNFWMVVAQFISR
jgi:hypothetical protein